MSDMTAFQGTATQLNQIQDMQREQERMQKFAAEAKALQAAQSSASRELLVMQSRAEALRQAIATFPHNAPETSAIVERAAEFAAFLLTGEAPKAPTH